MNRELRVTPDVASAAAEIFRQAQPKTMALAGGSTPRGLYALLAQHPEWHSWGETHVFFGDERCVPPNHPDSNYHTAHEVLLSKVPATVHRMRGEDCDAAGYETELRAVFGEMLPAFDLTILGMGTDGHTASLFPDSAAVEERERWVVRTVQPDHPRLTLTLPVLSASRLVLFLITGADKRGALMRLLADEDIPAARVQAAQVVVLADPAAAPELR